MYTDETILTFGEYKYWRLGDVNKEYLLNLHEKGCHSKELRDYIKANIESIRERPFVTQRPAYTPTPSTFVCDKITFPNEKEAKFALKNIKVAIQKHKKPTRIYECDKCGGWHLTSKPDLKVW